MPVREVIRLLRLDPDLDTVEVRVEEAKTIVYVYVLGEGEIAFTYRFTGDDGRRVFTEVDRAYIGYDPYVTSLYGAWAHSKPAGPCEWFARWKKHEGA